MSLDGVIEVSEKEGLPSQGDWTAAYRTPAGREAVMAAQGERFDLLLGRRTYDSWASFWPRAPSSPFADSYNAAKKYVATHRPESLAWGPCEGIGPDLIEGVEQLKAQDGPTLVLWGSGTLLSPLLQHGLADEVVLIIYPLMLGAGKSFFARGDAPRRLALVSTQATPTGVVVHTYRVLGPV